MAMIAQIRDLDPNNDSSALARLLTVEMEDPTTEEGLREDYEKPRLPNHAEVPCLKKFKKMLTTKNYLDGDMDNSGCERLSVLMRSLLKSRV